VDELTVAALRDGVEVEVRFSRAVELGRGG
jgi:hypothetical protein